MPELVAIGEPLVELLAEKVGPLGDVSGFRRGWGGDTSNFAVTAARIGAGSGYVSKVGDDEFGHAFLRMCEAEGVDSSQVKVHPAAFTGLYFVAFDQHREHAFTYYRAGSAASALSPADVTDSYIRSARLLHTSGITQAISDSARAAVDKAIDIARAAAVAVSYDANLRPKLRATEELRETFAQTIMRADIVFMSEQDATLVYGDAAPGDVMEAVLGAGPKVVVLKEGERGCVVASSGGVSETVDGFQVNRLDASGAGDAFAAAFVVEWLKGTDLRAAARFANAVGAMTAAGLGAVSAVPTRDEVAVFLRRVDERPTRTAEAERNGAGTVYNLGGDRYA